MVYRIIYIYIQHQDFAAILTFWTWGHWILCAIFKYMYIFHISIYFIVQRHRRPKPQCQMQTKQCDLCAFLWCFVRGQRHQWHEQIYASSHDSWLICMIARAMKLWKRFKNLWALRQSRLMPRLARPPLESLDGPFFFLARRCKICPTAPMLLRRWYVQNSYHIVII